MNNQRDNDNLSLERPKLYTKGVLSVKVLVILALLAALSVVLEMFLGVNTPFIKIHFGYLPIAAAGMLYGILPAVLVATVADIISNIQYFNIFFVMLAVLEGAIYGFFMSWRAKSQKQMLWQAIICQLVISVVVHAGLNTLLLWLLYNSFLPTRFVMNAITYPIKVLTLYIMLRYRPAFERVAR